MRCEEDESVPDPQPRIGLLIRSIQARRSQHGADITAASAEFEGVARRSTRTASGLPAPRVPRRGFRARAGGVGGDLRLQRVEPGEFLLGPDEIDQRHPQMPAVEIGVDVEEMRFEPRLGPPTVGRRPRLATPSMVRPASGSSAPSPLTRAPHRPRTPAADNRRGRDWRSESRSCARAGRRSRPGRRSPRSGRAVPPPRAACRPSAARGSGSRNRPSASAPRTGSITVTPKPRCGAGGAQEIGRAAPAVAKGAVLADDDVRGADRADDDLRRENPRRSCAAKREIEMLDEQQIDAEPRQSRAP